LTSTITRKSYQKLGKVKANRQENSKESEIEVITLTRGSYLIGIRTFL
jgi:hypothetical protein